VLLLTIDANQQGHKQADATTIHVGKLGKVQQDSARSRGTGFSIGVHESVFRGASKVPLNINDADGRVDAANVCDDASLCHGIPPQYLLQLPFEKYNTSTASETFPETFPAFS
jgi:hypothetical protein